MKTEKVRLNSKNLVILRDVKGWTQEVFGEKLEDPVTRQSLSRWENTNPILSKKKIEAMARLLECPYTYLTMETDLSKIPEKKEEIKEKIEKTSPILFQSNQQIFESLMNYRLEQKEIEIMNFLMSHDIEEDKLDLIQRLIERVVKKSKDINAIKNQEEYVHELLMKDMGEERERVVKAVLEEINYAGLAYFNYILDVMRREENKERYCYSQNFMKSNSKQLSWDIDHINATLYYIKQEDNLYTVYIETDKRFVQVFQLRNATVPMFWTTEEEEEAGKPAEERRVFEFSFYSEEEPDSGEWRDDLDVQLGFDFVDLSCYVPEQLRTIYEDTVVHYFNATDWEDVIELEI